MHDIDKQERINQLNSKLAKITEANAKLDSKLHSHHRIQPTLSFRRFIDEKRLSIDNISNLSITDIRCICHYTIVDLGYCRAKPPDWLKEPFNKKDMLLEQARAIDYRRVTLQIEQHNDEYEQTAKEIATIQGENYDKSVRIYNCCITTCDGKIIHNKCNVCKLLYCGVCYEPYNENHLCNYETLLSLRIIDETSKPCPVCKTMINKLSGCNQMFCTNCHNAFDWVSH